MAPQIQTSFNLDAFDAYPHVLLRLFKYGAVNEDGLFNWKLSIKDDFHIYSVIDEDDPDFISFRNAGFPVPVCDFMTECCRRNQDCYDSFSAALNVFQAMGYDVEIQGDGVVSMPLVDYIQTYNRQAQARNEPAFDVAFNNLGGRWPAIYNSLML